MCNATTFLNLSSLMAPLFLLFLFLPQSFAQNAEDTRLLLRMDNTDLQTGERYQVRIEIENPGDLWLANLEIAFNPEQIYVIGTQAGSPLAAGPLFTDTTNISFRNSVDADNLLFTHSLLGLVEPINTNGILGSFEIVPLQPGLAEISFQRVQLLRSNRQYNDAGELNSVETEDIAFIPVMIGLSISGDPVPIPSESTATPAPSPTPEPALLLDFTPQPSETPLINVTEAPVSTSPGPVLPDNKPELVPDTSSDNLLPVIALVLIGLALIGFLFLWRMRRP